MALATNTISPYSHCNADSRPTSPNGSLRARKHDDVEAVLTQGSVKDESSPREYSFEREDYFEQDDDDDDILQRGFSRPQQRNWDAQYEEVGGHRVEESGGPSLGECDSQGYKNDEVPTESDILAESGTVEHAEEDNKGFGGLHSSDGFGLIHEDDESKEGDGIPTHRKYDHDRDGYREPSVENKDEDYERTEGGQNKNIEALEERGPERAATSEGSVVGSNADVEEDDGTSNDDFDLEFVHDHDSEEDVRGATVSNLSPLSENTDDSSYRAAKSKSIADPDGDYDARNDDVFHETFHGGALTEALRGLPLEGTDTEEGPNVRISGNEPTCDKSHHDIRARA